LLKTLFIFTIEEKEAEIFLTFPTKEQKPLILVTRHLKKDNYFHK